MLKIPFNLNGSMILWFLFIKKLPISLLSMFPSSLKNNLKPKTNPLSLQTFLLSPSCVPYSNCKMPMQVHLKKINEDHTDEIMSSGEDYFDNNVASPWENHQTSLKSGQLKAATGAVTSLVHLTHKVISQV